ncbi:MAG: rRNA maturation RNase YbeY [Verrucomicrobiota bacterium]|jgi:rRNA maturation RNase YbeY
MRSEIPEVEIINHQTQVRLTEDSLVFLRLAALRVWPRLASFQCLPHHLESIEVLEIAFVSAAESDRAHREFMDVAGETDVITFLHGELVICPAVAERQAREHGEPLMRELLRYVIHGMLHLAGHTDDRKAARIVMEQAQEKLVTWAWENGNFTVESTENTQK